MNIHDLRRSPPPLGSMLCSAVLALLLAASESRAAEVELREEGEKIVILLDGKPFTEYLVRSGAKPVLWPIIGPSGQEMTRAYPLRPQAGPHEKEDHIHQRSFWFTHGDVNGISFWHEQDSHGTIAHREFLEVQSGEVGRIVTLNDWLGPDGKRICEDRRELQFGGDGQARWIDIKVTVTAANGPVTFGDTKEGSFGIRVAGPLTVDEKLGGRIENAEGLVDGAAWGKPSRWVDYSGPLTEGEGGITILDHPSSLGHPVHWHVRTYGLFAANPFGLKDFYGADSGKTGKLELAAGESFSVRYRVLFHEGKLDREATEAAFQAFAQE